MTTLLGDLRFAFRSLLKTPAVPLTAIATLALGIGATTAIFSTVNAAILRPLPYPNADELFALRTTLTDGRVTSGLLSPVEIIRLNDPSVSIVRAAGLNPQEFTFLADDGTPTREIAGGVSEGFFEVFGLPMTLGGFTHEHYIARDAPPAVVISHRAWRERFGGDPNIVGKPIHFAEFNSTIAGVAPPTFDTPHGVNFWFTNSLDPQGMNHSFEGFMRVKPGVNVERVRSEMASVMSGLAKEFPASDEGRVYIVRTIVEQVVGDLRSTLIIVLSATGLLLVLACVNVTNLLLARGASRSREMAVRVALGANRRRIIRQLLTESMLLAAAGTVAGLLLAALGVRLLLSLGAAKLPRLDAVPFDWHVLTFALVTLVVCGLFVGFAPALRLAGTDVRTLLNESGRSATVARGTTRWLGVMTISEIALAVMLVAGAGWLVRGFANVRTIDPGFKADGRLVFDVALNGPQFRDRQATIAWLDDLEGRLRGLPGVQSVGVTTDFPLRGRQDNSLFMVLRGEVLNPAHLNNCRQRNVSPGFFDSMGVKLIAGRDFTRDDNGATQVAIVNRTFARMYLANKDPLNERILFGYPNIDPRSESAIVGVVDDIRQQSLTLAPQPSIYTPTAQFTSRRQTFVVSTTPDRTADVIPAIRAEVKKLDAQMALDFTSAPEIVALTLQRQQLGMTLMLLFGASAILLAAVGIYGVIAHASAQRSGEMATRLALGASRPAIFLLMMRRGGFLAALGAAIGLLAAYGSGRVVASQLYEVRASDPVILAAAFALVVVIALVATAIPAGRAARVDPVRALRPE